MKLQLAFIKDKDSVDKLTEDINEMEKMLNEYLQFTSSSFAEKDELFNLSELMDEIITKYNNKNISKDHFIVENNLVFAGTHIIIDLWDCNFVNKIVPLRKMIKGLKTTL